MRTEAEVRAWRDRATEIAKEHGINHVLQKDNETISMILTWVLNDD